MSPWPLLGIPATAPCVALPSTIHGGRMPSRHSYFLYIKGDLQGLAESVTFREERKTISTARVMLGVQLLQALARYLRIDLRGREIDVAEQHLHHAQVGAVIQQGRGKRGPQSMR